MSWTTDQTVARLRAAGEPTRLRILSLLKQGDLAVGELVQILGQSQPRLSHHLKILTAAGLVTRLPEGSWVFYRAAAGGAEGELIDAILSRTDPADTDFERDGRQLMAIRAARAETAQAYFDEIAETWDTVRSLHYSEQAIDAALLDVIGPGPFRRVVDIGTGTGQMLVLLAPLCHKAEGLDLSHQMLTVARDRIAREGLSNAQVRQGDACATPFDSASADLVVLHQVLHFIDAPARVLAEADRMLMPGGKLVIVDFAPHSLEFLRTEHGHRRLGIQEDALSEWSQTTSLRLHPVRRFDPPSSQTDGLSVQIWAADKPSLASEAAA